MADSTDTTTTSQEEYEEYNKNPSSNFLSSLDDKAKYSNSVNIASRLQNINNIERDLEEEIRNIHNELTQETNPNPYRFPDVSENNNEPIDKNMSQDEKNQGDDCPLYKQKAEGQYNTIKRERNVFARDLNRINGYHDNIKTKRIERINQLIDYLQKIQDEREAIIKLMQDHKDATLQDVKNTASDLENYKFTMKMGKDYEELLDDRVGNFSQGKDNKKRMTEVVNYENKRMASQQYIFKVLAIGFLFILGGLMFGGPFAILKYFIVIIATFTMLYLIVIEVSWNSKRNKMDWNQINWTTPPIINE